MVEGTAENCFPQGLVLDDQLFGLGIVASRSLEYRRNIVLAAGSEPDTQVLFHLLNRGLWDQEVMDGLMDASTQAMRYSAVVGERLLRIIDGNTVQVWGVIWRCRPPTDYPS